MIMAEPQNSVSDYIGLGFDKNLNRLADDYYEGSNKDSGIISSLDSDRQFEGIAVNKLTSSNFEQVMNLGKVKLDGTKGSIEVRDKQNRLIVVLGEY